MRNWTFGHVAVGVFSFGILNLTVGIFVTCGIGPAMIVMGGLLTIIGFVAAI